MENAKVAAGLNEFSYTASLHISHPSLDPSDVTATLGLEPSRTTRAGQPHRSASDRSYKSSHWSCKLLTRDGDDIPTFLAGLVALLSPHQIYLAQLADNGGEIECFIGVFANGLCDQAYGHQLLGSLASLRVNLRLDLYAAKESEETQ